MRIPPYWRIREQPGKRSSSVRDIRPGAEKRPCSDQATPQTAGTQMLFRPLYQKISLPPTPALPFSSGDHLPGGANKRGCWTASAFRGQVSYDLRCSMAMLAVDIHTSYVNMPPPLLTFSTMFLSTRKHVASRVCRLHLRWHYIYIYKK